MAFADLTASLKAAMPELRGKISANESLAIYTWFRVGGPAQILFTPADEDDLAYFLARLDPAIAVTVLGMGSNVIIRDGGVEGVVIRLSAKPFGEVVIEEDYRVRAGASAPDMRVARAAAEAGIDGLAFYRGIPGSIGGALRMNAGAHGGETTDVLIEARAVTRKGEVLVLSHADMGFSYRHSRAPETLVFTQALFKGRAGSKDDIAQQMERITQAREAAQPIKEQTGGSTFKNPPHGKAWQLIDAAGCRGLRMGDAEVSTMHCNFLINRGAARAADIENLGEEVRRRVKAHSGVELEWEIKRIGIA
jgi:UDP-N-acetylmuramate dehydrogenase